MQKKHWNNKQNKYNDKDKWKDVSLLNFLLYVDHVNLLPIQKTYKEIPACECTPVVSATGETDIVASLEPRRSHQDPVLKKKSKK
jgi:hypothetical protein